VPLGCDGADGGPAGVHFLPGSRGGPCSAPGPGAVDELSCPRHRDVQKATLLPELRLRARHDALLECGDDARPDRQTLGRGHAHDPHAFGLVRSAIPAEWRDLAEESVKRHVRFHDLVKGEKQLTKRLARFRGNLAADDLQAPLKERRPLVLLVRETPLSEIHLENKLALARMGVVLMPPVPAFYNRPRSLADVIDHTVTRVLDQLGLDPEWPGRWEGRLGRLADAGD
jgi:flavoprotein